VDSYTDAREQLHTIAEWLLAGPQYAASGTIRLTVEAGHITTVAQPRIAVSGSGLIHAGHTIALRGTVAEIGEEAGLVVQRPDVEYHDQVPGGPDTAITAQPAAVDDVIAVYTIGASALALVTDEAPVLWPEHFDLGVRLNSVNLGVSPGDSVSPRPYVYVGPDSHDDDPFWNAPFGALMVFDPADEGAADSIAAFFDEGLAKARG
jgi:hypothetical protein